MIGFFRNSDGHSVAKQFGGLLITHDGVSDSKDESMSPRPLTHNEKRCLNIIEEQSLSASMPTPPLYLIPDDAINAFAAGGGKDDAIVAITQGSLDGFDRKELSGIIAHELGHIVSQDVRLNIRVFPGFYKRFTIIYLIGRFALNSAIYGSGNGKTKAIKLGLGIAIVVVGLITVLFGRILQSAMSRQREFLADASAIQFTRHPDGLISAFKKLDSISGSTTKIDSNHTSDFSHAFIFGIDSEIFSTHPPLKERIKRISIT